MICQEFSLQNLNKLKSITLAVTHSGGMTSPPLRSVMIPFTGTLNMFNEDYRLTQSMKYMYSKKYLENEENYQKAYEINKRRINNDDKPKLLTSINQLLCVSTHCVSNERLNILKNSRVPIWICTGTDDSLVRPENSHLLANILEPTKFTVFDGAGHGINFEENDKFNQELINFISINK